MDKGFPIFKLPTVPLTKISRYMDLEEIFKVSLASKKSAYIMGSLLPPNLFELEINLFKESEANCKLACKEHWDSLVIKGQKNRADDRQPAAQKFCDVCAQWAEGDSVKLMLSHLAIVFNPPISIDFEDICDQEFIMGVMNHVKQLNLAKKSIKLPAVAMSSENLKYILDEYRNISQLWLFLKFHQISSTVQDLTSEWMIYTKVSVWNCGRHQQLKYANLEVPRALIRKWIESKCRLEHFTVSSSPVKFDFRLILQGLAFRVIEQTSQVQSVEITRKCDGKKATVTCGVYDFNLKVID